MWMCKNSDFQISAVRLACKVEDRDCELLLVEVTKKEKKEKGRLQLMGLKEIFIFHFYI